MGLLFFCCVREGGCYVGWCGCCPTDRLIVIAGKKGEKKGLPDLFGVTFGGGLVPISRSFLKKSGAR